MCQEVHLAEIRTALVDYREEVETEEDVEPFSVDDFLADLETLVDLPAHGFEHGARAAELTADSDDEDAAAIHYALLANIARSAASA